jgi:5'-3' exonuclease
VVLIPFIDEARLLAAERSVPVGALTAEERARNALGSVVHFTHDAQAALAGAGEWVRHLLATSSTAPDPPP